MKLRERLLKLFFLSTALLFCTFQGMAQNEAVEAFDSVEVSILTCSPHDEVYSLYGHTALRYHDLHRGGQDLVFNYGVFNQKKPYFVLRFMFGLTDYELGLENFQTFVPRYAAWGCEVKEQVLSLTSEEKLRLTRALAENLQTENRVYRYNFFFDNCATRPRDIVESCINGRIDYGNNDRGGLSFREITHLYTCNNRWSAFGNDLLLGLVADRATTQREQQFLPDNLCHDIQQAMIIRGDGISQPLVKECRVLANKGEQKHGNGFPLSPLGCAIVLLAISLLVMCYEQWQKTILVWWDAFLMFVTGLAGVIIFLMLFSLHPCTTLNFTVLLLNPLPLFFIYNVVRRRRTNFFNIQMALVLLFLIGGLWQHYAEGLYFVALCLLLRYWRHLKVNSKK